MKRFYTAFSFVILFFISQNIQASSILGGDITWRCIGKDSFMITLTLYNDCNGDTLGNATLDFYCNKTQKLIKTLKISRPVPVDITPGCRHMISRCQNKNSSYPYGIEQYTFKGLVDLGDAGSCCEIKITFSECCRSMNITNGGAGTEFYTYSIMNRCVSPCDNSPTMTNPPIAIICLNHDFMFCSGITDNDIDTTNGGVIDSFGYEFIQPATSSGHISYNNPYSYKKPLYFDGFPNDTLPYPKGFHIDPICDGLSFKPMKQESTIFANKISEYRNGELIGEVIRNFWIAVINCPNNNPPFSSGPYFKEININATVCFNIATNDLDPEDTLSIGWNASISGAVWTDNNGTVKHPTGQLCWTPEKKHASNIPYTFVVKVLDDGCPVRGSSVRAYQILVKDPASVEEKDKGRLSIYPNPTRSKITVISPTFLEQAELNIYTVGGKLLHQTAFSGREMMLNTEAYPDGILILQVVSQGQTYNSRFVKIK